MNKTTMPLILTLTLLAGGCKSRSNELSYTQAYEQKLYAEAYDKAKPIAQDPKQKDREKAALIAGMSAYSLKRPDEAKTLLTPLRSSLDKDVSSRSLATLGLIAKDQGRHSEAAVLLKESSANLDGDDAAKAKLYAGDSLRKIGLEGQARDEYRQGASEADDPALKQALSDRSRPVKYVVQAGAYSTRTAADKQAKALLQPALKYRQPIPIVQEVDSGGRKLFAVQMGPYSSRAAAQESVNCLKIKGASVAIRQ